MSDFKSRFGEQMLIVGWSFLKYFLVSGSVVFFSLCFVTGKFPPPLKESYQALKEIRNVMNISQNAKAIGQMQKQRDELIRQINDSDQEQSAKASSSQADQLAAAKERVRVLEYEVALLKSKLNRAVSESQQLRQQLQPQSQLQQGLQSNHTPSLPSQATVAK